MRIAKERLEDQTRKTRTKHYGDNIPLPADNSDERNGADPINNTLAKFPALNAVKVDLIENSDKGRRIDPRRFDDLVEQITGQPAEAHVIVDTGSSAFVPLLHYVLSNEVQAILSQGGHQLVVHTIVTGGQALLDTLHGAAQLVKQMDVARFVIWLNPF